MVIAINRTGAPGDFDTPEQAIGRAGIEWWGGWKTFHRGTIIGEDCTVTFQPITGQRVRLNLRKTTEGPSFWEFNLFETEMK